MTDPAPEPPIRRATHGEDADNDALRARVEALEREVEDLRAENDELVNRYVEVESLVSKLSSLFVASVRLQDAVGREAVFDALCDILVNILGVAEYVVYELAEGSQQLAPVASLEAGASATRPIAIGEGIEGTVAVSGKRFVADMPDPWAGPPPGQPVACIALTAAGTPLGVLSIGKLLGHKPGLLAHDLDVLDFLGAHAGPALFRATRPATEDGGER